MRGILFGSSRYASVQISAMMDGKEDEQKDRSDPIDVAIEIILNQPEFMGK